MDPNQNINIIPYSLSSSSSSNMPNDSKKSEKPHSKRSILRKEGSQSKNKDKHATFTEPSLNQVAFYVPDLNDANKNNRISLNTVSEEPEPNSRSGSEFVNNRNISSNRASVNTEQRLVFDNHEINSNSFMNDLTNNNKSFAYFNNNNFSTNDNSINNNKNITRDNQDKREIIESKPIIFKNQNYKKPASRKTLDSDYILKEFSQTNDINANNINVIDFQNNPSKVVKIKLSNSGRNSLSNDNILNSSLEQNNSNINISSVNRIQKDNSDISNNSSNERRERIEQQTKLNTEANKNLFNIKSNINSLGGRLDNINDINEKSNANNMVNNMSNQINELIQKNNDNIKKPKFKNRITMAITKDNEYDFPNDNNMDINQNLNDNNLYNIDNPNIINDNLINNNNDIILQNRDKKMPKRNKKRITMAPDLFDENPNSFNDDLNPIENISIPNKSKKIYKEIENSKNEELVYVEPKIVPQNKNINYSMYEKYFKFNNLNFPKSESKLNNITNLNFPQQGENDNMTGSQTTKKELQIINNDMLLSKLNNLQNLDQNNINISELNKNAQNNKNYALNLDSSPLIDLINDKSFMSKNSDNTASKQDDKYNLILNNDENFDIEKEIENQISFIENNLEEKEKNWKNKLINNAARHTDFESEINKNKNEFDSIQYKINEITNIKNDLTKNTNKYEKLSEKAQKTKNDLQISGIEIKDVQPIMYKEMNCLLFTVMIRNKAVFKFLISNFWYEKNLTGDSEVTFIGVLKTEVFSNFLKNQTIMNKNENINELFQKYYYETICKVFPNEYEKITINNLADKYYIATQISICFLHILEIINHISLIDEDLIFNTQDLKKYFVKFSYIDIYSAKIDFVYELNIENPFSGNRLNSVEIEKNDYILNDFKKYRNDTYNLIWKYFNPKDIEINHRYFYNIISMLNYISKVRILKEEINDDYIKNVMQGNIRPKQNEFEKKESNEIDEVKLLQELEIIYGKKLLNDIANKKFDSLMEEDSSNNDINMKEKDDDGSFTSNSKNSNNEEVVLHLPSSNDDNNK